MNPAAPDTSVVVAGVCAWHQDHEPARAFLAAKPPAIAHVLLEAYSVLTRLPRGRQVAPELAIAVLRRAFPDPPKTLDSAAVLPLLDQLAAAGIAGGATYDALIAETARRADVDLMTLDSRAKATYVAVGVGVMWCSA